MIEQPKFMFIGKQRTSKTVQYSQFPKIHEDRKGMLVFNIDGKMASISNIYPETKFKDITSYDEFDFDDTESLQVLTYTPGGFEALHNNLKQLLQASRLPAITVIDSISTLGDIVMKYCLSFRKQSGIRKDLVSDKNLGVINVPDLPDWNSHASWLTAAFGDLKSLPSILIATAHLTVIESTNIITKELKTERIVMTGAKKAGMAMPNYFNEIYLFKNRTSGVEGEKAERMVITYPTDDCDFTGSHHGVPDEINITHPENPSLWEQIKERFV